MGLQTRTHHRPPPLSCGLSDARLIMSGNGRVVPVRGPVRQVEAAVANAGVVLWPLLDEAYATDPASVTPACAAAISVFSFAVGALVAGAARLCGGFQPHVEPNGSHVDIPKSSAGESLHCFLKTGRDARTT